MVMVQDFLLDSPTAKHFVSKLVTTYVTNVSGYVYLISPTKKIKATDSYENYSKLASFKMKNCPCQMPLCYATGMTGMFPIGYEVATFIDDRHHVWVMSSRVPVLSMQDKATAFAFLKSYFDRPIQDMIWGAARTAFYTTMSVQLKQVTVASTRALLNLDLIIFTLLYAIHNEMTRNDVFKSYCIPHNAWELLSEYDGVWRATPGSWLCRFLAYDALIADDQEIKQKFTRVRMPLISSISRPYLVHPQAVDIKQADNNQCLVYYKTELVGLLIMDDGDSFWLVQPFEDFLSAKAVWRSESFQLLIMTESGWHEFQWCKYEEELRRGRWRKIPNHRQFVEELDNLLETYFTRGPELESY